MNAEMNISKNQWRSTGGESIKCLLYCIMMVFWSFFTYFFQIVFNRNHMWIRCKILISVQGECRRRGRNHCCRRGDWIGWEWRGAERGEFIWLPRPSSFLLLIHSVDIIGEISVRSRNYKKKEDILFHDENIWLLAPNFNHMH